jgi:hypothetical protein
MLTREQRDKWAAALRSGKYTQHRGGFTDVGELDVNGLGCNVHGESVTPSAFCCLAVLEVAVFPGQKCGTESAINKIFYNCGDFCSRFPFVSMNDSLGLSFFEIADVVDTLPVSDE